MRVYLRQNKTIVDLKLELKRKNQECEALKKEIKTFTEKSRRGKGRKMEQLKRWRKNNPDLVKAQKKRWRERKRAQKQGGQTKKTKQSKKRQLDEGLNGEEEGRKKMRTLLEEFMCDIEGHEEQGEAPKARSAGANRAEERRKRRFETEQREEERKKREEEEETRRKRSEEERKKKELEMAQIIREQREKRARERKEREEREREERARERLERVLSQF